MHLPIQLCNLLLYALISTASAQESDRLWHSTTPGPTISITSSSTSGVSATGPPSVVTGPPGDSGPIVLAEGVASTEAPAEPARTTTAEHGAALGEQTAKDTLTDGAENTTAGEVKKEELSAVVESKKEKKDRKWMSAPKEEVVVLKEEENIPKKEEESIKEEKAELDKTADPKESTEESLNISAEISVEEKPKKVDKNKKPRKWISVPGEVEVAPPPPEEDLAATKESIDLAQHENLESLNVSLESSPEEEVIDEYSINAMDLALPANISDLLLAAEEGIPIVQETIISKKTTVYVTISDSLDAEPLYVNLTGIRHYTGQERRMVGACLDLSDLMINGEEAKEVIQRMAKHRFHRLYLNNNNITEFPANTFSPVAFTVRELRLDGNPLASNDQGEASVLQRGGLFHLTELRELNLSGCGLDDMDYFTPWNSNHLEVVDLSNNNLHTVPSNLQFFHKLKKLYVDGNPITKVTELPFALLWNLHVLSLADCQIATISDDPFRNMDKLKELSLEGNNLTQIGNVRLPRSNSAVKMFLSGNPWHCACEMLSFIEHYHYAIRDIEYIRCASPRWLEGLRTAYLTKEILSLDSVDGNCSPSSPRVSAAPMAPRYTPGLHADRLEVLALAVFVLAALFMLFHILWARKKDKYTFEDDRDDIHYIRIEKKPNFK